MNASRTNIWVLESSRISESEFRAITAILSSDEVAHSSRFYFEADRIGYLLAHGLTRLALAQAGGCRPADLRFGKQSYGRPYVTEPHEAASLYFNLSHTKGLVGVAVSTGPVGLDVECLDREINPIEIAEDILTAVEVRSLLALNPVEMRQRFFRLWTLKEAYLKATGAGFCIEPRSLSFEFNEDHLTFHPPANDATVWNFYSEFFDSTHCVAACYASCDDLVQIHDGRQLLLDAVIQSDLALRVPA